MTELFCRGKIVSHPLECTRLVKIVDGVENWSVSNGINWFVATYQADRTPTWVVLTGVTSDDLVSLNRTREWVLEQNRLRLASTVVN